MIDRADLGHGVCDVDGCDEPAAPGRGRFHGKCKPHQRELSERVRLHFRGRSQDDDHDARNVELRSLEDIAKDVLANAKEIDRLDRLRRAVAKDMAAAGLELAGSMRELRDAAQAKLRS